MSKYIVLRPISLFGERKERGEIIELTDEQAKAFSGEEVKLYDGYSSPPDSEPVTTGEKVEEKEAVKPRKRIKK
jgi:hypothetical protein